MASLGMRPDQQIGAVRFPSAEPRSLALAFVHALFHKRRMRRLERTELATLLSVALHTAPAHIKQKLRSKLAQEADAACDALADLMAARLDNRSYMVIAADMVSMKPSGERIGLWGFDEPDPFEHKLIVIGGLPD